MVPGASVRQAVRRRGLWAALLLLLLPPGAARGQQAKEIHQQAQVWLSLNSTTRLTDHWGLVGDVHVRRNDFLQEPGFYFLRFGGHYWLRDSLALTVGYAHMWNAPACDGCETWTHENRIYQQLQYTTRLGRTGLLLRLRNEQRWKDEVAHDALTGGHAFSDRVRGLASFTIPVSQRPTAPALVLSDEVLLQFGSGVVLNTFDQNRLFAGVKKGLGRDWSCDLGYMLVYQQKASGYEYDLNHTLRWFFYFTPDFRNGKSTHEPASHEE